ncbi:MAG: hypothetical protein E6J91_39320 [Deltaproteobacteria bacterium]|nr:MAG: hypothetical protein E6J91_39320 [Deltaproteobacteria bacterium]
MGSALLAPAAGQVRRIAARPKPTMSPGPRSASAGRFETGCPAIDSDAGTGTRGSPGGAAGAMFAASPRRTTERNP